jgi:hypothetical protein
MTSPIKTGTGGREMCKLQTAIILHGLTAWAYMGCYTVSQCRLGFSSVCKERGVLQSYNDTYFKLARLMCLTSEAWQRLCRDACAPSI